MFERKWPKICNFVKEDSLINFVLYNAILTFGGGGFLIWSQNLESVGLSEIVL